MDSYRKQLLNHDWGILLEKLTYITVMLARVKDNQIVSEGKTAQDIAAEAMEKTLSGERQWNPEKCPDILAHLAGSAKSIIWNLRKKKEALTTEASFDVDQDEEIKDLLDQVSSGEKEPLDDLIEQSDDELLKGKIAQALSDIPSGLEFFDLISMETAPRDIAGHLGLSISEVYNTHRTIKRRLINSIGKEGIYGK